MTSMNRRAFVTGLGAVLAAPLGAEAQQAGKVPHIGYATSNTRTVTVEAFEQGLRQLGYVIGQNIVIDYRFGEGHLQRVPALVNELLRSGIDVLFAANPHVIRAAMHAKTTVLVVGVDLETDPIRAGWVKTLARPGGILTGFFLDLPELSAKQVQFLIEAIPRLHRLAIIGAPRPTWTRFSKAPGLPAPDGVVLDQLETVSDVLALRPRRGDSADARSGGKIRVPSRRE